MSALCIFLGFALLATLSSSISVETDCIAMQRHEAKLYGTQTHISAWVGDSSDTLTLTLGYDKGHPYFYDYIETKHDGLEMKRIRENKETQSYRINFTQPLSFGWLDLDFIAEEKYGFNFTSQNVFHELIGESGMKLTTFTVDGSNTTVNCKFATMYWKVVNDVAFIPLMPNDMNIFILFSRSNFQPTLAVDNSSIELGFKDNAINDIQPYKAEHQKPLTRYEEHMVKIKCIAYQHCMYILGIDETHTIRKSFIKNGTTLTINGKGNDFFVKLNRIEDGKYPLCNATLMLPSENRNDGLIISTITLGIILLIMIPTIVFISLFIRRKQLNKKSEGVYEEMKPIMKQITRLRTSSINSSFYNLKTETRLWDAVVHNNQDLVRHLIDTGKNPANREIGRLTSPLEEAHLLGHKEIVKIFAGKLKGNLSVPTQDQIEFTLKELEKRMYKVFQAAKYGLYERGNGVNVLLQTHSLPGTIKDSNGWSLVHYMAGVKFSDERPAWEPRDIKNFFIDHVYYINAIDHWGNTPLHILSHHHGSRDIMWDGHTLSVERAWIEMAELFISYGCDPRIPNHQNILPHDLATRSACHSMATYLKEKCEEMGTIDHASAADKFDELIEASRSNEVEKIIDLLKNHVPMLPVLATRNPLLEAIRNGHQKVVFLLICAGTPICSCSIDDLTPLEAAHNTLGLPALFPALMRKIYSDRLKAERSKITQIDGIHPNLAAKINNIQKVILTKGDKTKWQFTSQEFTWKSIEARKLLVAASGLGLSLTVQLLGMEDVELRPSPNEESPVDKAQSGDHFDTLYVLCRDLKMAPYATYKKSKILKRLESDLLIAECKIFKESALDNSEQLLMGLDEFTVQSFVKHASNPKQSEYDWSKNESDLLYIFSRYGLIYCLNMYLENKGQTILDQVIQEFSGSTMLHISVLYGQQHITEYLLYRGASPLKKTKGGYTAAHIAAIIGYVDSMQYMHSYMKCKDIPTGNKCDLGMTAMEIGDQYQKMHMRCNYPILEPHDVRNVKNEIEERYMALEILRRKAKVMGIKNKDHLINQVQELQRNYQNVITTPAEYISKETELFFQGINNDVFKGNLKEVGQNSEGNVIFCKEVVNFTLELENFSAHGDSKNVMINEQSNGDLLTLILNKDSKSDLFRGNNFMKKFVEAIKERIKNFKPSDSRFSLTPPFLIPYACGVELCWGCYLDNTLYRVKTYIDPIIKADLPEINGIESFPEHIKILCRDLPAEMHVSNLKGEWTYRGYSLETRIFGNLEDNERLVWKICRFIKLISKKYWWAPTSNIRKPVHRLDVDYVGVTFPQERALKALFLKELAENPDKWKKEDIFERVISIYRRCQTIDNKGNFRPVESVKSFLLPTSYSNKMPDSVCGVVKYLEELKQFLE